MGSSDDASVKPRFEPPPWEKEAFDALAARRAEEQIAREALEAARIAAVVADGPAAASLEEAAAAVPEAIAADAPTDEAVTNAPDAAEIDPPVAATPKVEKHVVDAMLLQLASEERTGTIAAARVSQVVAALLMALGSGMAIGGLSLMRSANGRQIIIIGSLVLTVFGMMFMGMAVWVWIATSRSRGRS